MNMESPIIRAACLHLNPQVLTIPVATSNHFQGSVIHTKRGIQDASKVIDAEKAYKAKKFINATRLPMVMIMIKKPTPAVINGMATALVKNTAAIKIVFS